MTLGILVSHPIQYYSPLFRELAKRCDLTVFYAMRQTGKGQAAAGFGVQFDWDIDLLSGYKHHFLKNVSRRPGTDHFFGCDTPEIADIIACKSTASALDSRLSAIDSAGRFDAFLVIGWFLKSHWQAIRACRKNGIPVFIRGDSQLLTPRSKLKALVKELVYHQIVKQFDGYLVVGQRAKEYLQHYGADSRRMFFSPHFVDNDFFKERSKEQGVRSETRKRFGIAEDALCILFCGKFIEKKRPMDLIKAAQLLIKRMASGSWLLAPFSSIHLLFVGSGALEAQLRAECNVVLQKDEKEKGERRKEKVASSSVLNPQSSILHSSASFVGFKNQTELPECYAAADLLVLPSDGGETWGLVVNEAMACGVPAIVSDVVGCGPDLIEPGKTGETFPMGNIEALASAIERFIPKLGQPETAAALSRKMERYSVEKAADGVIEAITKSRLNPQSSILVS